MPVRIARLTSRWWSKGQSKILCLERSSSKHTQSTCLTTQVCSSQVYNDDIWACPLGFPSVEHWQRLFHLADREHVFEPVNVLLQKLMWYSQQLLTFQSTVISQQPSVMSIYSKLAALLAALLISFSAVQLGLSAYILYFDQYRSAVGHRTFTYQVLNNLPNTYSFFFLPLNNKTRGYILQVTTSVLAFVYGIAVLVLSFRSRPFQFVGTGKRVSKSLTEFLILKRINNWPILTMTGPSNDWMARYLDCALSHCFLLRPSSNSYQLLWRRKIRPTHIHHEPLPCSTRR